MSEVFLSVVIPAYNEEKRIRKTLYEMIHFLDQKVYSYEIVVVDDGSSDETVLMARQSLGSSQHVIIEGKENHGKGYAVRAGMLAARGRYILFSDADLSTPIEEADVFLKLIEEKDSDIVIGSRALPESNIGVHQSNFRELMGRVFNFTARLVSFRGIQDSQCGFKLFKRDVAHDLFARQKLDGFSFDAEILFLAQKRKYKVIEKAVKWDHSAQTRVNLIWDPLKMFLDLLKIRLIHWRM